MADVLAIAQQILFWGSVAIGLSVGWAMAFWITWRLVTKPTVVIPRRTDTSPGPR